MSLSNQEILINYLDNSLETADRLQVEEMLRQDADAVNELEQIQFSVALIREAGLKEQVAAIRGEYQSTAKVKSIETQTGVAVVRSLYKNVFRVAAMVLLLLGAAAIYEYSATSSASVFEKNYGSFDLNTSRGNDNDGDIEKAYRNKDWAAVKNSFAANKENNTKAWFLNGMAEIESKNYEKAIASFKEVMKQNNGKADAYFQDEAEYYLAMGNLAAGHTKEGLAILKKIRADKNHLFNKKASEISSLDLATLQLKGDK